MATCTILYKTLHRKYLRLGLKQPIKKDTKAQGDIILQIANFITVQCNH